MIDKPNYELWPTEILLIEQARLREQYKKYGPLNTLVISLEKIYQILKDRGEP